KVDFELKASKPLQKATLTTKEGDVIELQKRQDDLTWAAAFVVWCKDAKRTAEVSSKLVNASTTYRIHLLDTDACESGDPLWRGLALVRDQAPVVNVVSPGERLSPKPEGALDLGIECRDDYGLGAVRLLCWVNGEEKARELSVFPHDRAPEAATKDP